MMTDIDRNLLVSKLTSFADDTRSTGAISNQTDHAAFQADLDSIYQWADENNMVFNEDKFELLSFGRAILDTMYSTASGLPIERKVLVKDLGIHVSSRLNFKDHIEEITARGHRMAGYILRTFKSRGTKLMLTALKTLIIPLLEYGSIIWAPGVQSLVNLLESVQRSFTSKFGCFRTLDVSLGITLCDTSYKDRLKELQIYSFQRRLERFLIIHIHKILIKYLPNPGLEFHITSRGWWSVTPKHPPTSTPTWLRTAKDNSFFIRAPKLYNCLPTHLKQPISYDPPSKLHVEAFKRKLDIYLKQIRDDPDLGSSNSLLPNYY
jgi:hypothetical protein